LNTDFAYSEADMSAATIPAAESSAAQSVPTVYIVDDEADAREATARLVRSIGFTADCYASGQEFLDRYDEKQASVAKSNLAATRDLTHAGDQAGCW
jgi:hypothetical protein